MQRWCPYSGLEQGDAIFPKKMVVQKDNSRAKKSKNGLRSNKKCFFLEEKGRNFTILERPQQDVPSIQELFFVDNFFLDVWDVLRIATFWLLFFWEATVAFLELFAFEALDTERFETIFSWREDLLLRAAVVFFLRSVFSFLLFVWWERDIEPSVFIWRLSFPASYIANNFWAAFSSASLVALTRLAPKKVELK